MTTSSHAMEVPPEESVISKKTETIGDRESQLKKLNMQRSLQDCWTNICCQEDIIARKRINQIQQQIYVFSVINAQVLQPSSVSLDVPISEIYREKILSEYSRLLRQEARAKSNQKTTEASLIFNKQELIKINEKIGEFETIS